MNRRREDDGEDEMTPVGSPTDVFGDHSAVDESDWVADGFRPIGGRDPNPGQPPIRTVSAHYAASPSMTMAPTMDPRGSLRKTRAQENPFASPEDDADVDADTPLNRTPSARSLSAASFAPGIARRSISSVSSHQFAASHSPRLGVAGPSHPYGMYPQDTLARTPSVATSSTVRPSQSLRHRPQHPYGMYTQGVGEDGDEGDNEDDDDDDDDHLPRQNPVPVGFNGLGQSYRRVRGPEGEDQDIIGEDGHAEQLPPYSRYPDDGPAKVPLLAVPPNLHSRGPVAGSDPGMALMHHQMSRQSLVHNQVLPQSMTDQSNLEQSASLLPQTEPSLSEESSVGKKSWREKSWKEKRRTKFCGIPFWWILIALGVVGFVFAIIMGVVVGYIGGTRHAREQASVTVVTTLFDASAIATPTNAPPTGTFALSLGPPQATQAECLTDPGQQAAWGCQLGGQPAVAMSVGMPASPTPTNGAFLFYASNNTAIAYGPQYQFLETNFSPFIPVQDNDSPGLGPAFYFQQFYDKIVVVPQNVFAPPPPKEKRDWHIPPQWLGRKQMVQPGEQPWFCVFNDTFIEGFIYVQTPSAATSVASNASTSAATTGSVASAASATSLATTPWSSATSSTSSASAAITSPPASPTTSHSSVSSTHPTGGAYPPGQKERRQQPDAGDAFSTLAMYPYQVKLEERRLPNSPQPYCQQFQILDNLQYNWLADPSGNPIKFELAESDPNYGAYQSAGIAGSPPAGGSSKRDYNIPGGCHCQWMHGQ